MATVPTLSGVLAHIRPLVIAGASCHWLHPFDYVDENGYKRGKTPRASKWSEEPTLDLADLERTYRDRSNIGIRLGEPSLISGFYLHLIDLDVRKPELEAEAWAALLAIWPEARNFPRVISGSRGASRHIYFLSRQPFRKLKLAKSTTFDLVWDDIQKRHVSRNDWEIDLMGTGSQAVIPPSLHPDTGLAYEWEQALDFSMLDLGIGPIVAVESIEAWGARLTQPESDEDDLETLFNNSPLNLDDDQIDEILTLIPNDGEEFDSAGNLIRTGAHYDDYIEVGMALHHQYQGTEDGFIKWVDWASQASKFDLKHARYRWDKSFGDAKNPVRMATLIQKANTNRLKSEHDFETEDSFETGTALMIRPVTDLSALLDGPVSTTSLSNILSGSAPAPPKAAEPEPDANWERLLARNEEGELKSNAHNLALIAANDLRLVGVPAINEFTQEIVLRKTPMRIRKKDRASANPVRNLEGRLWTLSNPINGDFWIDSHDSAIRIMFEAPSTQGGYGIKVTDRDLKAGIDAAAQKNAFHPVQQKLKSFVWDGIPRAEQMFIDFLGCPNTPYHREAALMTLVGAVARVFEPGHKFDFVPILEGIQGKGKTTFIRTLAMDWYSELTGDISDVQEMVEHMQGSWIMEIGELSSMHKSEVNDLKAFVSRTEDKTRLAYGKRAMVFPRQCIFIGSTNDNEYLRDQTGGRRFWPIKCHIEGEIDNERFHGIVHQYWAEALTIYLAMRASKPHGDLPLYLRDEIAAKEAMLMQESRRVETSEDVLSGLIAAWLERPVDDETGFDDLDTTAPKQYRQETCTAEIWERVMGGKQGNIPQNESIKIGRAMTILGWPRTENGVRDRPLNKIYGKTRVYVRPTK
jgi:hypothetical protein